ncbi:MAG: putative motility protein [Phycisphaerales bacterium]|nr:putative motility protein [Phycisphaerales bacterium]MCB9857245.1 putative motility protein [Phycisphaerales bacterium]MCB9863041.1 putative motility protein [Phycisphaerales bacterium]
MNVSSVASAVTSLKAAETASQIQFAVAAKSLNQQKAQGAAVVKLIQSASENLDASIAGVSDAVGSLLDVAG